MKSFKHYLLITALCSCSFLHAATTSSPAPRTPTIPSSLALAAATEQATQAVVQNQTLAKNTLYKSTDNQSLINRMENAIKRFYLSPQNRASLAVLILATFFARHPEIARSMLVLIGINSLLPYLSYALCRS